MAVYLYKNPDCKGPSYKLTRNRSALAGSAVKNSTSSFKLTASSDRVLLFKKKNYRGGVLFRCGKKTIRKVSSKKAGGKFGFGNTISSARCTPFTIKLNVTVVCCPDGRLPGNWNTKTEARDGVKAIVATMTSLLAQALLEVQLGKCTFRTSEDRFDLEYTNTTTYPRSWKEQKMIDTIIVNTMERLKPKNSAGMKAGTAKKPWWGKTIVAKAAGRTEAMIANTLVHEVGHYLGLDHVSSKTNIMKSGYSSQRTKLSEAQIEEMHIKLSKNLTRKGDRHG